jgi:hypothetical protein
MSTCTLRAKVSWKEKTFDDATLLEAKQRAADWFKSTHGIKVTSSRVLEMHSGCREMRSGGSHRLLSLDDSPRRKTICSAA